MGNETSSYRWNYSAYVNSIIITTYVVCIIGFEVPLGQNYICPAVVPLFFLLKLTFASVINLNNLTLICFIGVHLREFSSMFQL